MIRRCLDAISYSAYRIKGDFQEAFTFRDYPFDSHTLSIRFRHKRLNSNCLLFVADDIGMQRDGGKASIDRFIDHSPLDTEENWNLVNVLIFYDIGYAFPSFCNCVFQVSAIMFIIH